jgi:hypothetical protein
VQYRLYENIEAQVVEISQPFVQLYAVFPEHRAVRGRYGVHCNPRFEGAFTQ